MTKDVFVRIMESYADMVTRICVLRTENKEDTGDCFQNTFLKCFQKLPDTENETYIKAWLIRVAINECNSYMRQQHKKYEIPAEEITAVSPGFSSDTVLSSVKKLKPKYRDVLLLYYYEDYSIKEIASILKKPENTIKIQLKRAREALKPLLLAR